MENIKFIKLDSSYADEMSAVEMRCFIDPWSVNLAKQELQNDKAVYIGAVDIKSNVLVGYAGFWHVIDEIEIMRVAVLPEYRRCGLAQRMLGKMESEWIDYGVALARLEVRESNVAARSLYESLGFISEYIRKGYYSDGENAVLMKKEYQED